MVTTNTLAEVASVIGEPARAAMLSVLMDGRALTASELAAVAGITAQTASTHREGRQRLVSGSPPRAAVPPSA